MDELRPNAGNDIKDIWPDLESVTLDGGVYVRIALGNGTAYNVGLHWVDEDGEDVLLVSVIDKGAYTFSGMVHYSYAMEKLNLLNWDAMNLADFINVQLGLTGKPQGKYMNACVRR